MDQIQASAQPVPATANAERITFFLRKVYGWMCLGMGISAAAALGLMSVPGAVHAIATTPILFWGMWLTPFVLGMVLQSRVDKIQPSTAGTLFFAFSALIGAWLSPLILIYTGASIVSTFLVTGGAFGAMALYGTVTRRSLVGWGQFLMMGFIGVFLATLVSAFWGTAARSGGLQFGITVVGVIVFTGMAAWKAQQMKMIALSAPEERLGSYAVVGALQMYITFINLFVMLLRVFGGRRN